MKRPAEMLLINQSRSKVLASKVEMASSPGRRFMGLMGRPGLPGDSALVLEPANSIHMFFMRFAIDAVFVDKSWRVLRINHSIRPWRVTRLVLRSKRVIELPSETCRTTGTSVGDQLALRPT